MADLDTRLLAAHAAGDLAALITLYTAAADQAATPAAAGFYLTQAYIFALDAGSPAAETLCSRLRAMGRE